MVALFICALYRNLGWNTIDVDAVVWPFFAGFVAWIVTRCVTILILYRRGVSHDEA